MAFPIDAFARRMVSRHVSRSARADFGLDALEQALHDRQPLRQADLIHHGDGGVQYGSILYTERLIDPGIEPSVGSVVDPYDNPVAEPVIGLFKAEVVHWCGPGRSLEVVEFAMLEWVDRFSNRRLLEPIGNIPPAKAEAAYDAQPAVAPIAAKKPSQSTSGDPGLVQGSGF